MSNTAVPRRGDAIGVEDDDVGVAQRAAILSPDPGGVGGDLADRMLQAQVTRLADEVTSRWPVSPRSKRFDVRARIARRCARADGRERTDALTHFVTHVGGQEGL
jgi:hypothetical protein